MSFALFDKTMISTKTHDQPSGGLFTAHNCIVLGTQEDRQDVV